MLEIDGEFFEDPCEDIRIKRLIIGTIITLRAVGPDPLKMKIAKAQAALISQQPLFPKFAEGGIVNPNTYKGDIVHVK